MRILIVENDLLTRQVLQKRLEKLGYEIIRAANGSEAWQIYQSETIKMVATDWMMPQMDGLTLCRNIRKLNRDFYTYIIFITARDREQDLVSVFDAGADDYIIKPFNPEELRVRLATGERIIKLEEEHKSLVNILRESRNKFRAVFDSLQEEIVSVDRKNNIISLNKSFLKGRGDKFSQVVGKNLF